MQAHIFRSWPVGLNHHHQPASPFPTTLAAVPVLDATLQEALRAHFPIHDFGTGYASRNYLKRLPLRKFKTYRWFVNNSHVGDNDQAFDAAVLTLAHKLGLRTVDEGGTTAIPQGPGLQ
jgi:hypothetical protein